MAALTVGVVKAFDFELPIVKIPDTILSHGLHGRGISLYALAACCAPPGSGKRVPAEYMVDAAFEDGSLQKGGEVVEPTSGGTGIALAFLAERKGFRFTAIVADDLIEGKRQPIRDYGATVLSESEVAMIVGADKSIGSIELAKRYAEKFGACLLNQYWNFRNAQAWEKIVAPQVWDAIGKELTEAFFGLGSCGAVNGFYADWKPRNPNLKFGATMPYRAQGLAGLRNRKRLRQVRPWEDLVDSYDRTGRRVAESLSTDLFAMFKIPAGESAGAVAGYADHYYSDLLEEDALPEHSAGFFIIMDTFAPYGKRA